MLTIAFQIFYNDDYRQSDEFIFYDLSREGQCVANCVVLKPIMRYVNFEIGVNMNCNMFYMEVIY